MCISKYILHLFNLPKKDARTIMLSVNKNCTILNKNIIRLCIKSGISQLIRIFSKFLLEIKMQSKMHEIWLNSLITSKTLLQSSPPDPVSIKGIQ